MKNKTKVKISLIKEKFKEWLSFVRMTSSTLNSLEEYTKQEPCLNCVVLSLEKMGYEIEYS